jgi:hypothetical protein
VRLKVEKSTIFLSGEMNEDTDFDETLRMLKETHQATGERVRIDLSNVIRGNSVGIMNWIRYLYECQVPICYVNAPVWLVEQFNTINDFFRMDVSVESFFARFYSEADDDIYMRCLTVGVDIPLLDDYSDYELNMVDESGKAMEADFSTEMYFDFLRELKQKQG